jgi:hypothetical protein
VTCLHEFVIMMSTDNMSLLGKPSLVMINTGRQLQQAGLLQHLQTITAAVVADLRMLPEPAAITEQLQDPQRDSPLRTAWLAASFWQSLLRQQPVLC